MSDETIVPVGYPNDNTAAIEQAEHTADVAADDAALVTQAEAVQVEPVPAEVPASVLAAAATAQTHGAAGIVAASSAPKPATADPVETSLATLDARLRTLEDAAANLVIGRFTGPFAGLADGVADSAIATGDNAIDGLILKAAEKSTILSGVVNFLGSVAGKL